MEITKRIFHRPATLVGVAGDGLSKLGRYPSLRIFRTRRYHHNKLKSKRRYLRMRTPKLSPNLPFLPVHTHHSISLEVTGVAEREKTMAIEFDRPVKNVVSPKKLAHVVLRTNNFEKMVEFYKSFLGARVIYSNEFLAFLTYDEEHHRIAIAAVPGTKKKDAATCGLEHIAFSFDTLEELLLAYRQRKQKGIEPAWPVNHGPTTSIYYKDPDGNMIETQVDNFEDPEEATTFMRSQYFAENPIGTDFDPEDLIRRLQEGADAKELKKRIEIGPRGIPTNI